MKKFLTILLSCLLLLTCAFASVACSAKTKLDIDDAAEALEENGYDVNIYKGDYYGNYLDEIVKKMLSARKEDGSEWVYVYEFEDSSIAKAYYKSQEVTEYESQKAYYEAKIKFLEKVIKECEDDMKSDEIDELEDEIKDWEEDLKTIEEYWEASGCRGEIVWFASSKEVLKDMQ